MRAGEDGRSIALTTGGESKSYVAISLENGRAGEREDGKIQIHHSGRHHGVCFPLFAGGSAWSPWRTAGSWRFVKRHAAKRKLNACHVKDEPLSAHLDCRHDPGRRIMNLPPRAAGQQSTTCVSTVPTRFTVRGIISLGSSSGCPLQPAPSSLVFPVQLTDLTPPPISFSLDTTSNTALWHATAKCTHPLCFPRHHGPVFECIVEVETRPRRPVSA